MSEANRPGAATPQLLNTTQRASSQERREHDRVPVNREFAVIDAYIAEYVTSISRGGVFIRSKKPLELGTRVTLKFSVILDDVETVEGEGEVVRVETSGPEMGMGVAFTRLSGESKALIDALFERYEAQLQGTSG
ncbi:hypothetical protein DV096_14990 [Bradymonadaceae bacterium TMQ3]|uniref:PilZ domain-containing protein n=1 Tax=Lujinxingia sediminis TaxID=2480984 RepID=A0ABY0CUN3_9DELT|nr:PilZ domain-containing protein [Lujinxingia sediminis]RDV37282.1 hypothetical protein DV096_14990 [Bradymonadaceae bacterium TMQ3]RVU46771.1 hypothetical protein EA187_06445 [Lujinxingia sediminis]TXC74781.1 hypothetical protein FRC91_14590 [Bradymonadales bacterium TMQ1]